MHKKSSLYNNAGVSKPEASPRNTRHGKALQFLTFCLAVYCGVYPAWRDTCPACSRQAFAHTSGYEPQAHFYKASPF